MRLIGGTLITKSCKSRVDFRVGFRGLSNEGVHTVGNSLMFLSLFSTRMFHVRTAVGGVVSPNGFSI